MLGTQDLGARGPSGVVTAGPWIARDSFIAETAVAIDRLTAKIERLERHEEALAQRVAELADHAQQATRFQALAESLRNSRDYKLDELVRLLKDARHRVEALEGPRPEYLQLSCKSLVALDRKLAEAAAAAEREGRLKAQIKGRNVLLGVLLGALMGLAAGQIF